MAKNLMQRFMQVPTPDHPKANWAKDFKNTTSADVGYGVPIFCDEILPNSNITLDIRAAIFTNSTVAPLYSRFKMQITAWWAPSSCYVPSLRDGVKTDATTDYSFPTINFDYAAVKASYDEAAATFGTTGLSPAATANLEDAALMIYGDMLPYVPTASIFSYLRMWPNNYSPLQFVGSESFPQAKNALPLLMYYDIFRNYIINNQESESYLRSKAFYPIPDGYSTLGRSVVSSPRDTPVTREQLDELFKNVRMAGMNYFTDSGYDITNTIARNIFAGSLFPIKNVFFKKDTPTLQDVVDDPLFVPDYHYGLWRDTYGNDPFVAFISDDNVDYERSTAKVVVDSSDSASGETLSITMEQIRTSSMIQNFVRSHIFRNNAFDEYTDVEYGCKPQRNLDKPMFLGAVSSYLVFNDVMSTAQTGDSMEITDKQQLGSRAAVGEGHIFTGRYLKDKKGNPERAFVKFHAPETGYLMLILTIKPDVGYFEGYDPMYDKHSIFDLYRPSLRNIGYQDKCYRHINSMPMLELDPSGAQVNKVGVTIADNALTRISLHAPRDYSAFDVAYANEPYGFEYMGKPNVITGQMSEPGTYLHWTGARSLNNIFDTPLDMGSNFADNDPVDLLNTTILPEMYHYIFANTQNLDNFQFFFDFDYNAYQVVPHSILSFK